MFVHTHCCRRNNTDYAFICQQLSLLERYTFKSVASISSASSTSKLTSESQTLSWEHQSHQTPSPKGEGGDRHGLFEQHFVGEEAV